MACTSCGQANVPFSTKQASSTNPKCNLCIINAQDKLNFEYAQSCNNPINLKYVFNELQKYKGETGSLSIPPDHPTYAKVIDSLSANEIESVIKKRWMQRIEHVKSLEQLLDGASYHASTFDLDLGKWIQTQLDHYILYKEGLPNPLCGKQIELLEDIGLQSLLKLRSVAERLADKGNYSTKGAKEEEEEATGDRKQSSSEGKSTDDLNRSTTLMGVKNETDFDTNLDGPVEDDDESNQNTGTKMEITDSQSELKSNGRMAGKCDVCRKRDDFHGHNLQRCRVCGLKVHELCYGLVVTNCKNLNFVCYACKAVGTEVEVNVPSIAGGPISKKNRREFMTQEKRPTECILCSFDNDEIHAMHPIMDTVSSHQQLLHSLLYFPHCMLYSLTPAWRRREAAGFAQDKDQGEKVGLGTYALRLFHLL